MKSEYEYNLIFLP